MGCLVTSASNRVDTGCASVTNGCSPYDGSQASRSAIRPSHHANHLFSIACPEPARASGAGRYTVTTIFSFLFHSLTICTNKVYLRPTPAIQPTFCHLPQYTPNRDMVTQPKTGAIGPIPAPKPAHTLPASIPAANRFFPPTTSTPQYFFFCTNEPKLFTHSLRILTQPEPQHPKYFLFCRNEPKD